MAYTSATTVREGAAVLHHRPRAAISWAAVFAGTVIASALSITLLTGGVGLGFIVMSPHEGEGASAAQLGVDRKSTRLNSSHVKISYAVFCLKKKTQEAAR